MRYARATKNNNYIEIGPTTIAEGATDTFSLLVASDSPNSTNVSDDTNIAACENNSYVTGGKVVLLGAVSTGSAPKTISVILYRDSHLGGVTDITDMSNVLQASTTSAIAAQKAFAVYRRKFMLTSNVDKFTLVLGSKVLRKLKRLRDGETVKLFVGNETATATNAIIVQLYGNIGSRC